MAIEKLQINYKT